VTSVHTFTRMRTRGHRNESCRRRSVISTCEERIYSHLSRDIQCGTAFKNNAMRNTHPYKPRITYNNCVVSIPNFAWSLGSSQSTMVRLRNVVEQKLLRILISLRVSHESGCGAMSRLRPDGRSMSTYWETRHILLP
jgi:hypothetical protein